MAQTISAAEALSLLSLITPTEHGIASRVLAKTSGGNVTLFAFDDGQGLTEHTSPFEAFAIVLDGTMTLTIGGTAVRATHETVSRMPANIPHAVDAVAAARMLLIMLRDREYLMAHHDLETEGATYKITGVVRGRSHCGTSLIVFCHWNLGSG